MLYYFAQFSPSETTGSYFVLFPDFDGCITSGDSLESAIANAQECLDCSIQAMEKLHEELPEPSDLETAKRKAVEYCHFAGIPVSKEGTFSMPFPAHQQEKPVQISVSILPSVLKVIDAVAKRNGFTRSGFIATAAQKYAREFS